MAETPTKTPTRKPTKTPTETPTKTFKTASTSLETTPTPSPDKTDSTHLYFSQNKIRVAMKSALTTSTFTNKKLSQNTLISEAAVAALNLACAQFLNKLTRESAIVSVKEATDNNQTELPLNVEYGHLADSVITGSWSDDFKELFPMQTSLEELRKEKKQIVK